ncbi:MAG: hypothetical protein JXA44_11705 [Methanospirillaceae archaeon]|nr:hypothetical protein [Methanospirillaceae archaeon]
MASIIDMLVNLIQMICVIIVVSQIVTRSKILVNPDIVKGKWISIFIVAVLFGLFAIFLTCSGFEVLGAIVNVRDMGPMIAGLIAGPFAGVGAGLIGGLHRLSMGGVTAVPCSIATILAGLFAGIIYLWYKRRFCGIKTAIIFAILMECLHMALILLITRPFSAAVEIVSSIALPMILGNAIGMAIFSYISMDFLKKQENEE